VNHEVAQAARSAGERVRSVGAMALRNVAEPVELFEIRLGPTQTAGAVDPVCRMWVDYDGAAGHFRHRDRDYSFCSLSRAATFTAAPGKFTVTD